MKTTVSAQLTPSVIPGSAPVSGESGWRALYLLGGVTALLGLGGLVFDIVLSMLPGWGPETVATTAQAWMRQFEMKPLLALRNLDLLNVTLSVLTLPMYLSLCVAHRRSGARGLALLSLLVVAVGTGLFAATNAALPLLELGRMARAASTPPEQAAVFSAANALLARGAHGSFGVYPAFLISEIGTLLVAVAMVRGGVFRRTTGWLGVVGTVVLAVYSTAYTFGSGEGVLIMLIALPGGLLMIAWQALVGRRLLQLAREVSA